MAQIVVSWFVSNGRFRVHAINAVGWSRSHSDASRRQSSRDSMCFPKLRSDGGNPTQIPRHGPIYAGLRQQYPKPL